MAKAEGHRDHPLASRTRVAAARIVRVRAEELFDHAGGVLDTSDIERVHDMRVASRRLRAVLEIFAACFPQGRVPAPCCATSRRSPTRSASAATPTSTSPRWRPSPRASPRPRARASRGSPRTCARARRAGNEILAAELERVRERDLRGRLMALSDAAEGAIGDEEAAARGGRGGGAGARAGAATDGARGGAGRLARPPAGRRTAAPGGRRRRRRRRRGGRRQRRGASGDDAAPEEPAA